MIFKKNIEEHQKILNNLHTLDKDLIDVSKAMINCIKNNNKIIFCGNGGSAGDSQHLAAEFVGRFVKDRPPIHSISLTVDSSALTCISNDYSYDDVFSRQLEAVGKNGDCLIGISTSGNSVNISNAFKVAQEKNITTIGLLGRDGGIMKNNSDYSLIVNSEITARIQEMHILIGHTLVEMVEEELFFK